MIPNIEFAGNVISWYQILILCGIFTAGIHGCLSARKEHDYSEFIILCMFIFIGVLVGGPILYAIVNYQIIIDIVQNIDRIDSFQRFSSAILLIFGGTVFYGGLIGGLTACFIVIKKKNKYRCYLDILAVNIPLFHAFGRIGCFLSGCCYGIESRIGFVYNHSLIESANGVNRFPVQLLEASLNFMLFFVLRYLYNKEKFKDNLLYVYLSLYATLRFFLEYFRGDTHRGIWLFLSTSQIISIFIFCFATFKIYTSSKKDCNIEK